MSKIFGIGFHKTGTTTLDQVFKILGYHTSPVRTDLAKSLMKGNMSPTYEVVKQYEAFQDNPWPILYKKLDGEFPCSKFILTYRSDESWIKSAMNHFKGRSTKMREWIYGEGMGDPTDYQDFYLRKFQKHNEEVRAYFKDRPSDFLEVSWELGDGWQKICKFLNKEIPNVPFPHLGKGNYAKKKKYRFFNPRIQFISAILVCLM